MPIFEYECPGCGKRFDKLVRGGGAPSEAECPTCGGTHAKRRLSTFASFGSSGAGGSASSIGCAPSGGG